MRCLHLCVCVCYAMQLDSGQASAYLQRLSRVQIESTGTIEVARGKLRESDQDATALRISMDIVRALAPTLSELTLTGWDTTPEVGSLHAVFCNPCPVTMPRWKLCEVSTCFGLGSQPFRAYKVTVSRRGLPPCASRVSRWLPPCASLCTVCSRTLGSLTFLFAPWSCAGGGRDA